MQALQAIEKDKKELEKAVDCDDLARVTKLLNQSIPETEKVKNYIDSKRAMLFAAIAKKVLRAVLKKLKKHLCKSLRVCSGKDLVLLELKIQMVTQCCMKLCV
jgi:hypothetical protein